MASPHHSVSAPSRRCACCDCRLTSRDESLRVIADNAVITLHGRRRELSLALEYAESMPVRDSHTYIRLLSACAKVRCCLHHLRKMGYMLRSRSANSMQIGRTGRVSMSKMSLTLILSGACAREILTAKTGCSLPVPRSAREE